jgi:hypothetical protein
MNTNIASDNFASSLMAITDHLPAKEQLAALQDAIKTLPNKTQQNLEQAVSGLKSPDSETNNTVWIIVISVFSLVLVGSALFLGIGYFKPPANGGVKAETILVLFTTAAAFLAGLFAPSPVAKSG